MELQIYAPSADGFIKEISWNHEEIKKEVAEKVAEYKGLIYSEDQIKEAKADRAKLKKFVEVLEEKRKEIKKQCLAPYDLFERQIKEITAIVNEPIALIDRQVKDYENEQKNKKQEEILVYFGSVNSYEWLEYELINDSRWLNASVKMVTVKAEIDQKLQKIHEELQIIEQLPEYSFEALEVYKTCLNLLRATQEAQRISDIARRKAEQEAKLRAEEQARLVEQNMNHPVEEFKTPSIEEIKPEIEERSWINFSACMTVDDAIALKAFFIQRGIKFTRI